MTTDTDDLNTLMAAIGRRDDTAALDLAARQPGLLARRSADGLSPLSLAAYLGLPTLLQGLRALHPSPDFFECMICGDAAAAQAWLDEGQDVNAHAPDGFTPVSLAAFFGHAALVSTLLDLGADPNARARNAQQVAALHAAVSRGHAGVVAELLSRGAAVDLTQQQGVTPLHGAAAAGRGDLVTLLLQAGASLALADAQGRTAADHAAAHGHAALAQQLRG